MADDRPRAALSSALQQLWTCLAGTFKAFPIQQDQHLLTVLRYVERNPVRAQIVRKAERYPWSSAGVAPKNVEVPKLHTGPVPRGKQWLEWVNESLTEAELIAMRRSVERGTPLGNDRWQKMTAKRLGLESSLRLRGRPRKQQ